MPLWGPFPLPAPRLQLGATQVSKVSSLGGLTCLWPHTLARSQIVGGPNLAQCLSDLASVLIKRGKYAEARAILEVAGRLFTSMIASVNLT